MFNIFIGLQFYEDLHDLLELTPKKDVFFIIGDWNAKLGSQEIPGVTGKFGLGVQNEAGEGYFEFCQEYTVVIAKTLFQQNKRRLYTWTSSDGLDHELLNAKFRFKLKKVGKTARPFRYDINQIPYDYTVEVRNRFEGLAR